MLQAGQIFKWARKVDKGQPYYEVSSIGDKKFSALIAKLNDGRTIEEAYQLDVKGYREKSNNWKDGKGKPPLKKISKEDLYKEYVKLWETYLEENPTYLNKLAVNAYGKTITDCFATTDVNQAHALTDILNAKLEIPDYSIYVKLCRYVNKLAYSYYNLNKSLVSDAEYDLLYKRIVNYETKYPNTKLGNSPTTIVGAKISNKLAKFKHKVMMYSLDNCYDRDEFTEWYDEGTELIAEPKYDGLSLSVIYLNGKLDKIVTRGNGIIGNVVNHAIGIINGIPLTLPVNVPLFELRGEVLIKKSKFKSLNEMLQALDKPVYRNITNTASGLINRRNTKDLDIKGPVLDFYVWGIGESDGISFNTHVDALEYISKLSKELNTIKYTKVNSKFDCILAYDEYLDDSKDGDLPMDGTVFKVNNYKTRKELGHTIRVPKWAIAYKFPTKEVQTTVVDITADVGKNGKVTPVANLAMVNLDGSNITNATLDNIKCFCKSANDRVAIGSIVTIKKSGSVIPKITAVDNSNDISYVEFLDCPGCKEPLNSAGICENENCEEKKIKQLIFYASKSALNIMGVSDATIRELYNSGKVKNFEDFYKLDVKYLLDTKIGDKQTVNLLASIKEAKRKPLEAILTGLSINGVGKGLANAIAGTFGISFLFKREDDFLNLPGCGEGTAKRIAKYIIDNRRTLIYILKEHKLFKGV